MIIQTPVKIGVQLSGTLDSKVKERTEDLANANLELESEIAERMRIDEARSVAENALQMEAKLVCLLHEIAVTASEAPSVEIAMHVCLDKVCVYSGFSVGHAYLPDSKGVLIPSNIWHFDQPDKYEKFRRVTETTTFTRVLDYRGGYLKVVNLYGLEM